MSAATLPAVLSLPRTTQGRCRAVSFLTALCIDEPYDATAVMVTTGPRGTDLVEEYAVQFDGAELLLWKAGEEEAYSVTRFTCTCPAGRAKLPACKHRDLVKALYDWMTLQIEAERPDGRASTERDDA